MAKLRRDADLACCALMNFAAVCCSVWVMCFLLQVFRIADKLGRLLEAFDVCQNMHFLLAALSGASHCPRSLFQAVSLQGFDSPANLRDIVGSLGHSFRAALES